MIYRSAATNPNTANIFPDDRQRGALYYDDPGFTSFWAWSVQDQTWVASAISGTQQVYSGHGLRTLPPANPALAALYYDLDTQIEYQWNGTAWV
jgi:hypothetical protein